MKVSVRDQHVLEAVRPLELAAYLRSLGWRERETIPQRASVWEGRSSKGDEYEMLLPLRQEFADYALRIAEVLTVLEEFTQRSQLQILNDLSTATADVVRVRAVTAAAEEGTISLQYGATLVQKTLDLMLAAASSAALPRPAYPTRKPEQAVQYVKNLRLGQTERGSFVLTLLSPVAPDLSLDASAPALTLADPFERHVTRTLARALASVRDAATQAATDGSFEPFDRAVPQGVSSNLCEAVAELHESNEDDIEFSFAWSPTRKAPIDVPQRVVISEDVVPYVREAARLFREKSPPEPVEVRGFVVKLNRENHRARSGQVTIRGFVGNEVRQVKVTLPYGDYQKAIRAHERQFPIVCYGTLERSGNFFKLTNPTFFDVFFDNKK